MCSVSPSGGDCMQGHIVLQQIMQENSGIKEDYETRQRVVSRASLFYASDSRFRRVLSAAR